MDTKVLSGFFIVEFVGTEVARGSQPKYGATSPTIKYIAVLKLCGVYLGPFVSGDSKPTDGANGINLKEQVAQEGLNYK